MKAVNLGMLFNNAVASTTAQGLFDPDSVQARIFEYAAILQTVATELGVDLNETSWSGSRGGSGGGDFEKKETKGTRFELDGQTWFDYRQAKIDGKIKQSFPDFKNYDTNEGVYVVDQQGNEREDALPLIAAADLVAALA